VLNYTLACVFVYSHKSARAHTHTHTHTHTHKNYVKYCTQNDQFIFKYSHHLSVWVGTDLSLNVSDNGMEWKLWLILDIGLCSKYVVAELVSFLKHCVWKKSVWWAACNIMGLNCRKMPVVMLSDWGSCFIIVKLIPIKGKVDIYW
jgi:hypothetical protein